MGAIGAMERFAEAGVNGRFANLPGAQTGRGRRRLFLSGRKEVHISPRDGAPHDNDRAHGRFIAAVRTLARGPPPEGATRSMSGHTWTRSQAWDLRIQCRPHRPKETRICAPSAPIMKATKWTYRCRRVKAAPRGASIAEP